MLRCWKASDWRCWSHKPAHFCLGCYRLWPAGVNLQAGINDSKQCQIHDRNGMFSMLLLVAGCNRRLKKPKVLLILLQFISPIWFTGCNIYHHDNTRGKRLSGSYILHDTFRYLLPDLKSLTTGTSMFLFMGTKRHLSTLRWHHLQCVV